jgi:hypothetical protein
LHEVDGYSLPLAVSGQNWITKNKAYKEQLQGRRTKTLHHNISTYLSHVLQIEMAKSTPHQTNLRDKDGHSLQDGKTLHLQLYTTCDRQCYLQLHNDHSFSVTIAW